MSIISSNHRLVKVNGIEYSAGSGIDITNNIISLDPSVSAVIDGKLDISSFSSYSATIDDELQYVSANAGNTYSAGDNIDIYEQDNDLYISAKDWTTDIANASSYAFNEATAQIPPAFDPTYMSGQIDNKLNKSDFDTYSGTVNTQISSLSGEIQTTSSVLNNQVTALRNDLNTVSTNTGYLYNDIQTTSGILSGAIDYVSSNLPEPFTGVNHDDNFSGDGKSTPLGIALHSTIAGNDIYGGPTIKLSGSDKEIMNIGSTQISLWHPASGVGGGAVYSYINGDGLDLTYNAGSYYLRTLKTTNSGLMIYNRGAIASSYLDGKGLYVWDGENVESAGLNDIQKWNSVYNDVTTASGGWGGGDVEVNEYVYNNSATINDVDTSYIQNSGTFLTAHQIIPSAKWEDASDVVQSNSAQWSENTGDEEVNNAVYNNSAKWNDIEVYQTNSGIYLTAHQDISNKLDTTAFSTVSGTFLTAHQDLSNYATTGDLNNVSGILSGAIDYVSGVAITAHQDLSYISGQVDNKLDTTAFSNVSSTFLTAHQIIPSAKWEEASTEYEQNSGTYLTAHQDISNKLDTTAFSTVSGTFLTAVDLTPYYTTADANTLSSMLSGAIDYVSANAGDEFPSSANEAITAYQNASGTYLTAHQPISANEWNSVYETVEANSGSWTGGGGGSIDTIPFVVQEPLVTGFTGDSAFIGLNSTAINLSAYVPYSAITDNYGDGYVHYINGSAIYASTADWSNNCNYANVAYSDSNGNTITNYYEPKLTIAGSDGTITAINSSAIGGTMTASFELSAGAGISIVDDLVESATVISVTAAGGNPEVESYVQTNSASINEVVSTYETNSGTYLTAHQDISNKLDTTAFSDVSGTFLTAVNIPESASWNDVTTAYQTNSANYLTSHQPISSNEWNSNYDTVLANSSTWTNGGFTGEVYGISGVSPNVDVYIDQQTLWISAGGFASQSDINYLSGAIGDVETLLSQL